MSPAGLYSELDALWAEPPLDEDVRRLLAPIGFADPRAAGRCLRELGSEAHARHALAACLPAFLAALGGMANPDRALANFDRFARVSADPAALYRFLAENPRVTENLTTLFAGSQYLTEILLRRPAQLGQLLEFRRLTELKSRDTFEAEARIIAAGGPGDETLDALRRWQQDELLRIGICDLLGLFDMTTVTRQLSYLADSLVRACLALASSDTGIVADGFVVLAMGKLGGEELNYSSDIDLLFIGERDVAQYRRLGERVIDALTRVTSHGFLYRVDMRLRPWGRSGPLISSLEGHLAYLKQDARLWEKQALLKARPIAGNQAVGNEFLRRAGEAIYAESKDRVRADVHAMKQRTEAYLRQHGRGWGEVKLGEGSIRDVEFVTQFLQLTLGARHPSVLSRNTLDGLARLHSAGFITGDEQRVLSEGYIFLRTVEHYLQIMDYRQTYSLPSAPDALQYLAHRLAFQGPAAGERLVARYQQHSAAIRGVYRRYLEANDMDNSNGPGPDAGKTRLDPGLHVQRMGEPYAAAFTAEEIGRHAELAARLDDQTLVEVEATPTSDGRWRVTVVGYDFFGELSVICGLLFAYGFNIQDGDSFTYEPAAEPAASEPKWRAGARRKPVIQGPRADTRKKIVDVFTVDPAFGDVTLATWAQYANDLGLLLRRLQDGRQREAQGELVKRVAVALQRLPGATTPLYPIDIEIDNEASAAYTVLRIDAPDTIGFLYEFTNALALNGIYIARMTVSTIGNRVRDTFSVTDTRGQKITSPEQQRELRAATVLVKHFTHLLPQSPNPEAALMHFGEFLGQLFTRPQWPDELASLERPEVLHALARLLGVSEFLWDDFLRMQHANLFPVVTDLNALEAKRSRDHLRGELIDVVAAGGDREAKRAALNAFKDREMFRIDMRHIQGHITRFGQFSAELTELAEVVVDGAYRLCLGELTAEFGEPLLDDARPCPLSILGLGKVGGRELGFASDIELMFVYAGNGRTSGPKAITTTEFYEKLVEEFLRTIEARREGIFQVDLQLRPYGKQGNMAVSLDAFRRYFGPGGPAWAYERQALIKLRPIAGNPELGRTVVALRDEFAYGGERFDTAAMRGMRERQVRHLVAGGTVNAKYSPGGLVDLEYLVQGMQINHGVRDPALRATNTREGMTALAGAGLLTQDDFTRLRDAHRFLRRLIDALRMVRGSAKDLTVPAVRSDEFAFLARRLGYSEEVGRLQTDLSRHMAVVQELNRRLLS